MMSTDLPTIRLRPKTDAAAIRHGAVWIYDNEVVTDRRTRALTAGVIARLEDSARDFLALVAVNPNSRIFARVLDRDPDAIIDRGWISARLTAALELRQTLYPDPFYRLIHAEADGLPGVIVDRFGDVAVVQPNAAWAEILLDEICAALLDIPGLTSVIKNAGGRARQLEGLDDAGRTLAGSPPDQIDVPMNGATYVADLMGGQKTGLYFDQRPNQAFVAGLARGGDVLDVFSHVGGFSLAALVAGAKTALAVDASAAALDLARLGAERSGVADAFKAQAGDAFKAMAGLEGDGRQFDVVICDPPAFAPGKKALSAGLRAYEKVARQSAPLVRPGGYLTLCSCSGAAELAKFRSSCARGIGRAGRTAQLIRTGFAGPDHPILPNVQTSGYLKALTYRILS